MRFGIIANDRQEIEILFDADGTGEECEPTATFFPPTEPVDEYQAVTVKLLDDLLRKPQFARDFCLLLRAVYDMGCCHGRREEESDTRKEVQMEEYNYQTATEEQMHLYREYNCIVELPTEVHEYLDEHPGALSGVSWEKGG